MWSAANRLPAALIAVTPCSKRSCTPGGQVSDQQLLGNPHRGRGGVETDPPQRGRPILTQIDADRAPARVQLGTQAAKHFGFEVEYLRPVDLVNGCPRRPPQPVRPGVQAGRQDHHLANARPPGVGEEFVDEPGVRRADVEEPRAVGVVRGEPIVVDHADEVVEPGGAHQLFGEGVVEQPPVGGDGPCGGTECRGHPPRPAVAAMVLTRRTGAARSARRPPASRATGPR